VIFSVFCLYTGNGIPGYRYIVYSEYIHIEVNNISHDMKKLCLLKVWTIYAKHE